mgnify:FL=1
MVNMKELKQLGKKSKIQENPEEVILESVDNPHKNLDYIIRLSTPEFTSICPLTSQPDFGNIIIDYMPKKLIVESKSFKLYLFSFRNHGAFHEDCTLMIAKKIIKSIAPKWLRIGGFWNPRGGIPIVIFFQTGVHPRGTWIDDYKISSYKGR